MRKWTSKVNGETVWSEEGYERILDSVVPYTAYRILMLALEECGLESESDGCLSFFHMGDAYVIEFDPTHIEITLESNKEGVSPFHIPYGTAEERKKLSHFFDHLRSYWRESK
jgi:hypothetical protein